MKFWPPKLWPKLGLSLRKTARVTVETEQLVIIRRRRITRFWCSQCGSESEFIPVEAVNRMLSGGLGPVQRLPLGDQAHFCTAADGSVVVCVKSLSGSARM